MRQGNDVLAAEYSLIGEVCDVFCDLAGLKSGEHRIVIDDLGTRLVYYPHAVAHCGKRLRIEHVVGILVIGDIDAYIITVSEYFFDIVGALCIARKSPRGFDRHKRVVAYYVHIQRKARVCDQRARCAQAENADGFAHKLGACEIGLALFHERGYLIALIGDALYPLDAADDVARGKHHRAHGLLLYRLGIRAGAVENDDALFGKLIYGNVIIARSGARNAEKLGIDLVIMHIRTADDYSVGRGDILADVAALGFELIKADGRNFVYCFNIIHGVLPRIFSYNRPELARPPWAWRYTATRGYRL